MPTNENGSARMPSQLHCQWLTPGMGPAFGGEI
jgi:hypothetical protein